MKLPQNFRATLAVAFLITGLLSTPAVSYAEIGSATLWPEQDIAIQLRAESEKELTILLKKTSTVRVFTGVPTLIPQGMPELQKAYPKAAVSSIPADHPYQLVIIDHTPLVLDHSGRVIVMPRLELGARNVEVAAIPGGAVVGYKKTSGSFHVHLFDSRVFSMSFVRTKDLGQFMSNLDVQKKTFQADTGRLSLAIYVTAKSPVIAMREDGKSHLQTHLELWDSFGKNQTITNKNTGKSVSTKPAEPTAPKTEPAKGGLARLRQARQEQNDLLSSLKTDIIGQDFALERIAAQMAEAQKNKTGKPKVLIATGPSGAGKTYTAGKVANNFHKGALFEVSGNEYRAHAGSLDYMRLLGSPANDKGEGSLVKFAKDHPKGFTFVINEGEKMHPDVWLMLMEFFDTGVLSDKAGNKVKVENLFVMITSNRGANRMFPATAVNWTQAEVDARLRSFAQKDLSNYFQQKDGTKDSFELPPEIMKRVDELIPFGIVTREAALAMARNTAARTSASYRQEYSVTMILDEAAIKHIASAAWENGQDARTIMRAINGEMSKVLDQSLDGLNLQEGNEIRVTLKTDARGEHILHASANDLGIDVALSTKATEHPLARPEVKSRLKNLEKAMNAAVIGQQQTISDLAVGVVSHTGRGGVSKPFTAYLLGVSGNGKTETGRALAKAAYGDEKRVAILPMGEISDSIKFDEKFGIAASTQGGDVEREFEKILREFPEGAVIVLDEISNMGGGDQNRKSALFQKLYNFVEEGKYISPRDGREFLLNKYKFILTGNDGEELFRGITGDDMLLETWKRNNSPDAVRELMRRAGIPNAFINRMDVISLTKPLLSHEVAVITKTLWDKQIRAFNELYRGVQIEPEAGLLEQLSKTFFTADQGGRGVRKILENKIGGLLLYALMNSDADLMNLHGTKLRVGLRDSASSKAYISTKNPRTVVFRVQVEKEERVVHTELLDVTKISPRQILLNQTNARLTAFHEAGHAVANLIEITGERMGFITIRGGSTGTTDYYGYARYEPIAGREGGNYTREQVIALMARMQAGRIAQQMAGHAPDAGWSEDLKQIRTLGTEYLLRFGLERDFLALRVDKEGNPVMSGSIEQRFEARLTQMMDEAHGLAVRTLKANWPLVRSVSAELLFRGQITNERYEELRQKVAAKSAGPGVRTYEASRARSCRAAF